MVVAVVTAVVSSVVSVTVVVVSSDEDSVTVVSVVLTAVHEHKNIFPANIAANSITGTFLFFTIATHYYLKIRKRNQYFYDLRGQTNHLLTAEIKPPKPVISSGGQL